MVDWVGYEWLAEHYGVRPVQPFAIHSSIAKSRKTLQSPDGRTEEDYTEALRPANTLAGHLTFALKREGIHLEFLARLFDAVPSEEMIGWIEEEPTGQYARRACFFYEYLTGKRLDVAGVTMGNYVNALDAADYLTASRPINHPRWRVRDNLPGTRDYCPLVRRTEAVRQAEKYDCARELANLDARFGTDILQRSVVWLTTKESRASFAIENESQHVAQIQRCAAAMERRCGRVADPLSNDDLTALQAEILGPRALRYGIRRSPVFVGRSTPGAVGVDYIAPHWDDISALLAGLESFEELTRSHSSVLRAAVLSFGFVYIHPMADGNGRISRFLINDTLRRDGAIPEPFVLPVSATIAESREHRRDYDRILERHSRPLMSAYAGSWRFGDDKLGADGVRYNLEFDAYSDARPAWRYPDLTAHVEYLADVIAHTINIEMPKEARYLQEFYAQRVRVKSVVEGPDPEIDRIIRSIEGHDGQISNKLAGDFPALRDPAMAEAIIAAVMWTADLVE
ncbi:MAG: Fic family protein [Dokdonella sp.]